MNTLIISTKKREKLNRYSLKEIGKQIEDGHTWGQEPILWNLTEE